MSLMVSFCGVLFSRDVLDEIWELIESVSEVFPTYSYFSRNKNIFGVEESIFANTITAFGAFASKLSLRRSLLLDKNINLQIRKHAT